MRQSHHQLYLGRPNNWALRKMVEMFFQSRIPKASIPNAGMLAVFYFVYFYFKENISMSHTSANVLR